MKEQASDSGGPSSSSLTLSATTSAQALQQPPERFVLLAAGSNADGQLGIGHAEDAHTLHVCRGVDDGASSQPFPPRGYRVAHLDSGAGHTVALLVEQGVGINECQAQRQIWAAGTDKSGQIGGTRQNKGEQEQIGPAQLNTVCFQELPLQTLFDTLFPDCSTHWTPKHIACGWDWTLVALESRFKGEAHDDELIVLGTNNDFGQLGLGTGTGTGKVKGAGTCLVPIKDALSAERRAGDRLAIHTLASGVRHSLALLTLEPAIGSHDARRHYVCAWGAARHGQCGEQWHQVVSPERQATTQASHAARAPVVWTPRIMCSFMEDNHGRECTRDFRIRVGKEHSAILVPSHWRSVDELAESNGDNTPRIMLFGSNRQSQLNIPADAFTTKASRVEIECTWNTTLLLQEDAQNDEIRLAGAGAFSRGQLARDSAHVPSHEWVTIAQDHTCAEGDLAQLSLVCGSEHALLLLRSGHVLGWGWNEHGNLAQGTGDDEDRLMPTSLWPTMLLHDAESQLGLERACATNAWAGCGTSFVQVGTRSCPS